MLELKSAIIIVEIIVGVAVLMILGDYLGYKVGRSLLAVIMGGIALASMVLFAIYAAVVFASR
jgi:hypothetical protein